MAFSHLSVRFRIVISAKHYKDGAACQECQPGLNTLTGTAENKDDRADTVYQCYKKNFMRYLPKIFLYMQFILNAKIH